MTDNGSSNGHRMLTAEQMLTVATFETKTIEVRELGGAVKVRGLTRGETHAFRRLAEKDDADAEALEHYLIAAGLVEPHLTVEQAAALKDQASRAVSRIVDEIMELSGLLEGAVAQAAATFRR